MRIFRGAFGSHTQESSNRPCLRSSACHTTSHRLTRDSTNCFSWSPAAAGMAGGSHSPRQSQHHSPTRSIPPGARENAPELRGRPGTRRRTHASTCYRDGFATFQQDMVSVVPLSPPGFSAAVTDGSVTPTCQLAAPHGFCRSASDLGRYHKVLAKDEQTCKPGEREFAKL